jgi:hypothetical protein
MVGGVIMVERAHVIRYGQADLSARSGPPGPSPS